MANKKVNNNLILEMHDVTKVFPGVLALNDINLSINVGEIHGLIGKNGAGKTTLVSLMSGVLSPTEGEILIKGRKYKALSRVMAKKQGVSIVTQEPEVIAEHSVAESLFFPDYPKNKAGLIKWDDVRNDAKKIIGDLNLKIGIDERMGDLTVSTQQLLAIIKSFYVENSPIVILDESSASLSDKDSKILYDIMDQKKNEGKAIVFISHRTDEILNVCDVVTVLRDGEAVKTVDISELDPNKISSLIVGKKFVSEIGEVDNKRKYKDKKYGNVLLSVDKIVKVGCFKDISFKIRKGEIVGLAGLRGSGRTEIMKSLVGVMSIDYGEVKLMGKKKLYKGPSTAYKDGIVYLPEEREKEGIVDILSVRENLILVVLRRLAYKFVNLISSKKENELAEKLVDLFDIKTVSIEQQLRYLSGGNKQKVVFGKIFASKPHVYLLDEPTKGIDIATKSVLLDVISKKLSKNSGIVLTSPGLAELMKVCDRILVLFNGEIIKEVYREDFDEKKLYLYMQGSVN